MSVVVPEVNMKNKLRYKQGFSLLEVLVFISILSVFFVTAISISISTLKTMQVNEHRIIATRYAEELMEWLRSEKESSWEDFQSHFISWGNSGCRVFNDENITDDWWSNADQTNCNSVSDSVKLPPAKFTRKVDFNYQQATPKIDITVTVFWTEGGVSYSVPVQSSFTPWQ
jgi:prepilin-type N-terminal cleavage/methylation domain-containing protein